MSTEFAFILLFPALIFALYAQYRVTSAFEKFSKVPVSSNLEGYKIARNLLDRNSLQDITLNVAEGKLTDNYDPRNRSINLSKDIYYGSSVAAAGIVAHEVAHAVQESEGYFPLKIRSSIVPIANFGSNLAIPLFFAGIVLGLPMLMDIGIIFFSLAVAFTVITLPVEFNASKRALIMLKESNYLSSHEISMAKNVLDAAALTYVAATTMALVQLFRLIAMRQRR